MLFRSPQLRGKLDGSAIRVPTPNVSAVDLTFISKTPTTETEVNAIVQKAAQDSMQHVISYDPEPKVSVDFNHSPYSGIFAPDQTRIVGNNLVRTLTWYDNEWGFSCRMVDVAVAMAEL